jgi:hypothetical protein
MEKFIRDLGRRYSAAICAATIIIIKDLRVQDWRPFRAKKPAWPGLLKRPIYAVREF